MKTVRLTLAKNILLPILCLAAIFCLVPLRAAHAVQAQTLTVGWDNTDPKKAGLARVSGDADLWSFNLAFDGVVMVDGPHWHYPGQGAADPSWGAWTEGDSSLEWSGSNNSQNFTISVTGKIRRAPGGAGGGGGTADDEEKDFSATWDGGLQSLLRMEYSTDGSTWATVPQPGDTNYPIVTTQYSVIDFRAVKANDTCDWPDSTPLWTSSDWSFVGEDTYSYFDTASSSPTDLKTIAVQCGNSISTAVLVSTKTFWVTSEKSAVCAGGIANSLHETTITSHIVDTHGLPLAGEAVTFEVHNSDPDDSADELGTISSSSINTDVNGEATVTYVSSQVAGAANVIVCTHNGDQESSPIITCEDVVGKLTFLPDNLTPDGTSTSDLQLKLLDGAEAVAGHHINWSIIQVLDMNNNLVNNPGSEYGTLDTADSITGSDGIAHRTYHVGTLGGTVIIQAIDDDVYDGQGSATAAAASALAPKSSRSPQFTPASTRSHPSWSNSGKNTGTSAHKVVFSPDQPNSGFDYDSDPRSLMIPNYGNNTCGVSVSPSSKEPELQLQSAASAIAVPVIPPYLLFQDTQAGRSAILTAHAEPPGQTDFIAQLSDGQAGKLHIYSRPAATKQLNVFFLDAGKVNNVELRSAKSYSDVHTLVDGASLIWSKQANVTIHLQNIFELPTSASFDNPISLDAKMATIKTVLANKITAIKNYNSTATQQNRIHFSDTDKNLVLVWQPNVTTASVEAIGDSVPGGTILAVSDQPYSEVILAHELGHTFNCPHVFVFSGNKAADDINKIKYSDYVMNPATNGGSRFLTQVEADYAQNQK